MDFLLRFVLQLRSRRRKVTGSNTLNSSLPKGRSHINEIVNF
ncbi:hypothetical protein [Campylobacter troglodytis]|nr:hypothetical protein [Campylobacter troglodytis]